MRKNFIRVSACRICGNKNLVDIVDLGEQYLTGIFPIKDETLLLTKGPLQLVKCHGNEKDSCGLVQLRNSFYPEEMYGANYGYRSGLNPSMVEHLSGKIHSILKRANLNPGDIVLDIGSNDGTSLAAYPDNLVRVGIDPAGRKFNKYYPSGAILITEFFSANLLNIHFPEQKIKVITSFSMMYDLEDPQGFVNEIASLLDVETGLWVFEQSYLPTMLEQLSFDTICHEHIEYYCLKQINWLLERANLRVVDVEFNNINGGSFSVVAAHVNSQHKSKVGQGENALLLETTLGLDSIDIYVKFNKNILKVCDDLKEFLGSAKTEGKRVCAIGASTKGNVLLQYCEITEKDIEAIGEINPDKFGLVTPGTGIPIVNELDVLASKPDYLVVLPWHFRENFLLNPAYIGQNLVFPLPKLEIVKL
jgi:hypothetical protein